MNNELNYLCFGRVDYDEEFAFSFQCSFCLSIFSKEEAIKEHFRLCPKFSSSDKHNKTNKSIFVCEICSESFTNKHQLATHLKLHTSSIECAICHMSFNDIEELTAHADNDDCNLTCSLFSNASTPVIERQQSSRLLVSDQREAMSLDKNLQPKNKNVDNEINVKCSLSQSLSQEVSKSFSCHICNVQFEEKCVLEEHLSTHSLQNCTLCHRIFLNSAELQRHVSDFHVEKQTTKKPQAAPTHPALKRSQCPICQMYCSDESSLEKHVLVAHSFQKCIPCNIIFTDPALLQRHLFDFHMRTFSCCFCNETFSDEASLDIHRATHINTTFSLQTVNPASFSMPNLSRTNLPKASSLVNDPTVTVICDPLGSSPANISQQLGFNLNCVPNPLGSASDSMFHQQGSNSDVRPREIGSERGILNHKLGPKSSCNRIEKEKERKRKEILKSEILKHLLRKK